MMEKIRVFFSVIIFLTTFNLDAQITVGDSLSPGIFYRSFSSFFVGCYTYCGPSYGCDSALIIDLNQDAINDFKLEHYCSTSPGGCEYAERLWALNSKIQVVVSTDTTLLDSIQPGTVINNSNQWGEMPFKWLHWYYNGGGQYINKGHFDSKKRFFGFRIIEPSDTLYGWFQVYLNGGSVIQGITLISYAFNRPSNSIEERRQINTEVYPNPATDLVTIRSEKKIDTITIYNTIGGVVFCENLKGKIKQIDLKNFPEGIYFITTSSNESIFTNKVIVNHSGN